MTMPDPEADQRARLTCARLANGDPEILAFWLDALALWPGQEDRRRSSILSDRKHNGKVAW